MREFLRLAPAHHDHLPAGRIALGVAVPLFLLLRLGHLALYASFAVFTGIYARHEPLETRLRHRAQSAALLLACQALGGDPGGRARRGPGRGARGGARPAPGGGAVLRLQRHRDRRPAPPRSGRRWGWRGPPPPSAWGWGGWARSSPGGLGKAEWSCHGLRHLLAAGLAGGAGLLTSLGHPPWAMVAAVAPISVQNHRGRVRRALERRIVGTLGGVAASGLLLALPPRPWGLVVLIVARQLLAEMFVTRNDSVAPLFVTPLALLIAQLAHPVPPPDLLAARAGETVIGALTGLAVVVLVRSAAERRAN